MSKNKEKSARKKKNRSVQEQSQRAERLRMASVGVVVLLLIITVIACVYMMQLGMIPEKIVLIIAVVSGVIIVLFFSLLLRKRASNFCRYLCMVISVLLMIILVAVPNIISGVFGNLSGIFDSADSYVAVSVYVPVDSPLNSVEDLMPEAVVGTRSIVDTEHTEQAMEDLKTEMAEIAMKRDKGAKNKVIEDYMPNLDTKSYVDFGEQIDGLYNMETDVILLNEMYVSLITEEMDPDFVNKTKVIHTFRYKKPGSEMTASVDVTKEPFTVYISGIDKSGDLSSDACSDVNILAVVDPIEKEILLVNIPRDFYVGLEGDSSRMDKLTHAGTYGVDVSAKTVGALFDIDVDYYVRVNYNSVIDIVDALGGIDVYSEYSFWAHDTYKTNYYQISEGMNHLNGVETLHFARHRMSLPGGDRDRGKNQQAVIVAIVDKVTSPAIITNFDKVLSVISENVRTNMTQDDVNAIIKMQLTDMAKWDIKTVSVDGTGASMGTYTYGSQPLYVMVPNQTIVEDVKAQIQTVLKVQGVEPE
jgi:LCP family protein required for cell wall assembly